MKPVKFTLQICCVSSYELRAKIVCVSFGSCHKNLILCRFYCESCDQAICRDCTMGNHSTRDHRYSSLSEAIERQRLVIEQLLEKVRKREPLLRRAIQTVEEMNTKLAAKAHIAKTEINKCYPKLVKALEERHKFMLNEVDKMFHGKAKVLNFQQRGLEVDLENLLNACKVTGNYLLSILSSARITNGLRVPFHIPTSKDFTRLMMRVRVCVRFAVRSQLGG